MAKQDATDASIFDARDVREVMAAFNITAPSNFEPFTLANATTNVRVGIQTVAYMIYSLPSIGGLLLNATYGVDVDL
jgi:hypothetical protein